MGRENNRNFVINFKVTEREKKMILDDAYNKCIGISEYVRRAVFLDLVISGNVEAIKYVASSVQGKILKSLISIFKNNKEG